MLQKKDSRAWHRRKCGEESEAVEPDGTAEISAHQMALSTDPH